MPSSPPPMYSAKSPPPYLMVGQVTRPQGVRGALRLQVATHYPERLAEQDVVFLTPDPEKTTDLTPYEVESARLHQHNIILKLKGIDDRNTAELLRQQYVMVTLDNAVPLEPDEYYYFQLIGLEMVTDADQSLGTVTEILETGANPVYVVDSPTYGELLIPAIPSVIQSIDLEGEKIIITPLEGLLPDNS